MPGYLSVHNWDKFQQYKDREPKWIKLYRTVLMDYKYDQLSDAEFGQLVKIWLLASQMENKIPNDPAWIQKKASMSQKPNIDKYIQCNFLFVQDCTDLYESVPRVETDKSREETDKIRCPQSKIVDLWAALLPALQKVRDWGPERQALLRARWSEDPERQNVEWWERFFKYIGTCPFLLGEVDPKDGRKRFFATLPWVLKKENFLKIIEGNYEKD